MELPTTALRQGGFVRTSTRRMVGCVRRDLRRTAQGSVAVSDVMCGHLTKGVSIALRQFLSQVYPERRLTVSASEQRTLSALSGESLGTLRLVYFPVVRPTKQGCLFWDFYFQF